MSSERNPVRPTIRHKAVDPRAGAGFGAPMAAFAALTDAARRDPVLRGGIDDLPDSEFSARERARLILQWLERSTVRMPDEVALAALTHRGGGEAPVTTADWADLPSPGRRWHVAPLYGLMAGSGERLEVVVDPFFSPAPLSLAAWTKNMGAEWVRRILPETLDEDHEALLTAGETLICRAAARDASTLRAGMGSESDAHTLAALLRAWIKHGDAPGAQVLRFRSLFGERAWRGLIRAYPRLLQQIDAEVKQRAGR